MLSQRGHSQGEYKHTVAMYHKSTYTVSLCGYTAILADKQEPLVVTALALLHFPCHVSRDKKKLVRFTPTGLLPPLISLLNRAASLAMPSPSPSDEASTPLANPNPEEHTPIKAVPAHQKSWNDLDGSILRYV